MRWLTFVLLKRGGGTAQHCLIYLCLLPWWFSEKKVRGAINSSNLIYIYICYLGVRGAAEEQLAERQRLTVTSTDQRPLAMRSVHFPFDCDAFLQMIPKLNQEIDIV